MTDEAEWRWITEAVSGTSDHVVLASSLPLLLPRGIHYLEAWSEAVCDGAWGPRAARAGERLRQAVDLEHWASFRTSFAEWEALLARLATSAHKPPASITILGGDIHHSYLAPVNLGAASNAGPKTGGAAVNGASVNQVVCSPIRNLLPESFRLMNRLAASRAGAMGAAVLARLAGVRRPRIRWRISRGPWFENMLCALDFDGRAAHVRFDRATTGDDGSPVLQMACEERLS